jgi:transposase InsO family protein
LGDLKKSGRLTHPTRISIHGLSGHIHAKTKPRIEKLRRKGYRAHAPGDLIEMDTIMTFKDGMKRYTVTAIDVASRFAFAWTYPSLSSRHAADCYEKFRLVAPFAIKAVHTDNGAEFLHEFRSLLEKYRTTHFFNYPRRPQWNGHVERFNRTLQDEFISWREERLFGDLPVFNRHLINYLVWYDGERPHHALGQIPPLRFLFPHGQSQSGWTHTNS